MKRMSKHIILTIGIAILFGLESYSGTISLSSGAGQPRVLEVEAPSTSGLQSIYVADGMAGVTAVYRATDNGGAISTKWYRYSTLGGAYAEEITEGISVEGTTSRLSAVEGDMGYIVEEGTSRTYFWVVDYSQHRLELGSLSLVEQDCMTTSFALQGSAKPISYVSITGRMFELTRDLKLEYYTDKYDEESGEMEREKVESTIGSIDETLRMPASTCETTYLLIGDRFLEAWGKAQMVESESISPIAVSAHTEATQQTDENADNIAGGTSQDGSLGGSAPAVIEFTAEVTEGAIFVEWQFSKYSTFDDYFLRVNQPSYTYTFDELGTYYVRFVCNNSAGSCEFVGDTYTISIGESQLQCPNAFSPGASEGVNDLWKVSYRSIVQYECHIFNRWGKQLFSSTDPSEGWDGKVGENVVPAGVYYYVIKARGADGRKYNLSGDINVVNYH